MTEEAFKKTYLGDGAYVYFDGWQLVLTTSDGESETNRVCLEPSSWLALLNYGELVDTLRQEMLGHRERSNNEPSPQWRYIAQYRSWQYRSRTAHVELAPRHGGCDRGRWLATVTGVGDIDHQDGFPRYFMDLERAKIEMQEWLDWRMKGYEDTEINRRLEIQNKLHDVHDALVRLHPHVSAKEFAELIAGYGPIEARIKPGGFHD